MDIKTTIKQKGLTLAQVAQRMDITAPTLTNIINGNITLKSMRRIAYAIGCDVTDFFADESPGVDASAADRDHAAGSGGIICPHCGRPIQLTAQ